jgi:hypothetical protein
VYGERLSAAAIPGRERDISINRSDVKIIRGICPIWPVIAPGEPVERSTMVVGFILPKWFLK